MPDASEASDVASRAALTLSKALLDASYKHAGMTKLMTY
jgi:hypothetical protein